MKASDGETASNWDGGSGMKGELMRNFTSYAMSAPKTFFGAVCLLGMAAGGASATTITFNGLAGANGDPFTTYTESGFTVSPTLGTWFQGQAFGNPVPSIFSGPFLVASPPTRSR